MLCGVCAATCMIHVPYSCNEISQPAPPSDPITRLNESSHSVEVKNAAMQRAHAHAVIIVISSLMGTAPPNVCQLYKYCQARSSQQTTSHTPTSLEQCNTEPHSMARMTHHPQPAQTLPPCLPPPYWHKASKLISIRKPVSPDISRACRNAGHHQPRPRIISLSARLASSLYRTSTSAAVRCTAVPPPPVPPVPLSSAASLAKVAGWSPWASTASMTHRSSASLQVPVITDDGCCGATAWLLLA